MVGPVTERAKFTSAGCKHNAAVRQVAGVHVIGLVIVHAGCAAVLMVVILFDSGGLVIRREGQLAHWSCACARVRVNVNFKNPEPLGLALLPVKHDLPGIEMQIKTPEDAMLHLWNQIRHTACFPVEHTQVAAKAITPINEVRVEMTGMVCQSLDKEYPVKGHQRMSQQGVGLGLQEPNLFMAPVSRLCLFLTLLFTIVELSRSQEPMPFLAGMIPDLLALFFVQSPPQRQRGLGACALIQPGNGPIIHGYTVDAYIIDVTPKGPGINIPRAHAEIIEFEQHSVVVRHLKILFTIDVHLGIFRLLVIDQGHMIPGIGLQRSLGF